MPKRYKILCHVNLKSRILNSYLLKGSHGLYWDLGSDGTLSANSNMSTKFSFELLPNNRMLIKGPNGCYLKGEQSGSLTSNIQDPKSATQWEF